MARMDLTPDFGRSKLATPDSALCLDCCVFLIAIVADAIIFVAGCHAVGDLGCGDIGNRRASAMRQCTAISISHRMFAHQLRTAQQFFQTGPRGLATFPADAVRVGAGLAVFGGVNTIQPKALASDLETVAILHL